MRTLLLLAGLAAALAPTAAAQPFQLDPDTRDQVTFTVERAATVENDEMTVTLAASHTDLDATVAADAVNRTMQEALERVRKAEGVEFRTGSYTTQPVHPQPPSTSRPREQRWRVEQTLILASRDFGTLRAAVTDLQAALDLRSVGFALSQERRIEEQRGVRAAALAAFREDAERIREALGFSRWEIVELQVFSGTQDPLQRHAPTMALSAESSGGVAPVVLEGGSSEVTCSVQARIQLLR